jgi:hypothetical protein
MSSIPISIIDNFLENPDEIRKFALSQKYQADPNGTFPGSRSIVLEALNPHLHNYISQKVLHLFFETLPTSWDCNMAFQKIPNLPKKGWIHQDPAQFTCILYLSPETNTNCGTSLYKLNTHHPYTIPTEENMEPFRILHHLNKEIDPNIFKQRDIIYQKNFKKTLDVKDIYNRIFCFPSPHFHSANYFNPGNGEDRLTLVMFFKNISHPSGFPIFRSNQTLMM